METLVLAGKRSVYESFVLDLFSKMPYGRLRVTLPDGQILSFGDGSGFRERGGFGERGGSGYDSVTGLGDGSGDFTADLEILDGSFFKKCVLFGDIGFGEAFVEGLWKSSDVCSVIKWFLLNIEFAPSASGSKTKTLGLNVLKFFNKFSQWRKANTVSQSKENIAEHYDLNNDFFRLFLDPSITYSSAYFYKDGMSLQEAQMAKYERLCRQLRIKESDHVLEIGSGWGGNAIYMAKNFGCQVTSVTISEEQFRLANERIKEEGLSGRIHLLIQDYRELRGKFDKIVSIEMLEAVGHSFLDVYFKKCHELLKPNGLLALQVITCPDSRYESLRRGVDWIQKHIFPGSLLPSVAAINRAINNTGDLTLVDLKDMGLHYVKTLAVWKEQFNKNIELAQGLGFNDAFIRKWNYYFGYCEAAFAMRNINVMQMVYSRPNNLEW